MKTASWFTMISYYVGAALISSYIMSEWGVLPGLGLYLILAATRLTKYTDRVEK